ncbi:MAG: hypothetical protein KGI11_03810 [Thaumarchaeota archaeon]|nr:hypothetical protein [Nitrososphaerota archaeon]
MKVLYNILRKFISHVMNLVNAVPYRNAYQKFANFLEISMHPDYVLWMKKL